jgi:hypothetical protein
MASIVAPKAAMSVSLATEEGMKFRDGVIDTVSGDRNLMTAFFHRRRAVEPALAVAYPWFREIDEVLTLSHPARWVAEKMADVHTATNRMYLLEQCPEDVIRDARAIYSYHLEDVFDDVLAVVEWEMEALT